MQELDILKIVLERLNKAGIKYMLTGSVALAHYVQPRMTRDTDIVVELALEDADKIYELFKDDFYIDRESVNEAINQQTSFNIIYNALPTKFDFIIRKNSPYRKLEFKRRKKITFEGIRACVVSIEDLILSKLYWAKDSGSEMQLSDVRLLLTSKDIDSEYLKEKAKELNIVSLLKEITR